MNYRKWVKKRLRERFDKARGAQKELEPLVLTSVFFIGAGMPLSPYDRKLFQKYASKRTLKNLAFNAWFGWSEE